MVLPKLVVFDLDCTLWPYHVDSHGLPPYKHINTNDTTGQVTVCDSYNTKMTHYPDVPQILQHLSDKGVLIGIASRTSAIDDAKQLVKLFGWQKYISFSEIYPGCKKKHFAKIAKDSGIPYNEMIFFDDEERNIRDLRSVGVHCVPIDYSNGMNMQLLKATFEEFAATKRVNDVALLVVVALTLFNAGCGNPPLIPFIAWCLNHIAQRVECVKVKRSAGLHMNAVEQALFKYSKKLWLKYWYQ